MNAGGAPAAPAPPRPLAVAALTLTALTAFAANSLLCRMALGRGAIDPASFATVRVASGALTLLALSMANSRGKRPILRGNGPAAGLLFIYMVTFAWAYVGLKTGTGALLLFGTVQVTMIGVALRAGDRPHRLEWVGLLASSGGLLFLVLPGLSAPPPGRALLMMAAGLAWGLYSLRGRGSTDPLGDTAGNFTRALPAALAVSAVTLPRLHLTPDGILLAAASGALASGLGYAVWYAALRGLRATRAALVQLAVPLLAALGGVVFLGERWTPRLGLAMALILGGVALALQARSGSLRASAAPGSIPPGR